LIHFHPHTIVDVLQITLGDEIRREQSLRVAIDRIVLLRPVVQVGLRHVVLIVMLGVALRRYVFTSMKWTPLPRARARPRSVSLVHREHVIAVHRHRWNAVSLPSRRGL